MSSRLFQVVREDHGLAYNIHSSVSAWSDCGDLVISAGLEDRQLEKVLGLVMTEARRLARRPPGRAEFERARDYALGQLDLSLEGSEQKMMWLGEQVLGHGRVTPPELIKARLAAVTPAAIQAAAVEFFRAELLSIALISPRKSTAGLADLLTKGLA
jgi:predicted Zn-dependent peptidase